MLQLSVTPKAKSDLLAVWLYTSTQWGPEQADAYLDQLALGMNQLTRHPQLGISYAHVLPGYRRLQVEHHCVFYRVLDSEILVIRVLHKEMDAPERLLD
ncbi:MAG: type II toxin-antitoxin system RelE/ParE family toxin [Idiomarina sp.]|nr:type II toxin-antitoxin system RelE/ParE family toxin [Idiomarina sp.]